MQMEQVLNWRFKIIECGRRLSRRGYGQSFRWQHATFCNWRRIFRDRKPPSGTGRLSRLDAAKIECLFRLFLAYEYLSETPLLTIRLIKFIFLIQSLDLLEFRSQMTSFKFLSPQ